MTDTCQQVFLTTLAGHTCIIDTHLSETIGTFKRRVQEKVGVPAAQQRLVFGGRELAGDKRILSEYNFTSEPTVHLLLRLRGGTRTLFVMIQMPKQNSYLPVYAEGPDDSKDQAWKEILRNLYQQQIIQKLGPNHVFSFLASGRCQVMIKDIDEFVAGVLLALRVHPAVETLTLQYVRTESPVQSTMQIPKPVRKTASCGV